jgi:platelet-activating factor acetylhydrolase
MIFSHGLGGNRNAYSHLAGSLASYGVVVICPEHRDGSAALSLIRDPESQDRGRTRHIVPYCPIPHNQTNEVWEARNKQLRIRLWELGLVFEAVSALDRGDEPTLRSNLNHSTSPSALHQFTNTLDIHEPGKVIFSGHSFGAATIVQLLKSTFYANHPSVAAMPAPLFTPDRTSALRHQVTPHTPTILLDMWCFPLLSASTAALYNLPLPCYSPTRASGPAPGGAALLAVESQAFYTWSNHLHCKARILSPSPSFTQPIPPSMFGGDDDDDGDHSDDGKDNAGAGRGSGGGGGGGVAKPHFFYVASSAHLSQSDFGVLFPRLTKRVFKADRPARVLRLNLRAQLQFLRQNGVAVAGTARADLVDGPVSVSGGADSADGARGSGSAGPGGGGGKWVDDDKVILEKGGGKDGEGRVDAWRWIDIVGLGGEAYPSELDMSEGRREEQQMSAEQGEREMQAEIEPAMATTA